MNFIKENENHSSAFYSCTMKNASSGLGLSLDLLQSHHHAVCGCLWNHLTRVYEDIFASLYIVTVCVYVGAGRSEIRLNLLFVSFPET